jgi:hypothetical protein
LKHFENGHESITDTDFMGNFISIVLAAGGTGTGAVAGGLAAVDSFSICSHCDGCFFVIDQEHPFSSGSRIGIPAGILMNVGGVNFRRR